LQAYNDLYMTDGTLLREILGELDLASYGVVIMDEAHERTLTTGILASCSASSRMSRSRVLSSGLKLLISSETLNAEKFSDYFDMTPVFKIPGRRRYKVDIHYTRWRRKPSRRLRRRVRGHGAAGARHAAPGDILLFLTGQEEIETVEEILRRRTTRGLAKWQVLPQFRLFTEYSYNKDMEDETVPEIRLSNLASVVLSLKALGINDLVSFDFMDPPASDCSRRSRICSP
jgi:HrpA-like RNA helicase